MHYIIDFELVRGALSVSILTTARRPGVTRAVSEVSRTFKLALRANGLGGRSEQELDYEEAR